MMAGLAGRFRGDGLTARALRSMISAGGGMVLENVIRLAGNLVLTRLLFPEAFGTMALVQVVVLGLALFSDIGTRPAIVQNPRGDDPLFLDTAFVLQIVRGIVVAFLTAALAAPAAVFYETPLLAQLIPVVAISAFIEGFHSTKLAWASRKLMIGPPTILRITGQIVGLLTMIVLALVTRSVWALALGMLATSFTVMVGSHLFMPGHRNRFRFERAAARELLGFGKWIFLSTVATFVLIQGDRAVLGAFVSLEDLAFYNIAFFLATAPFLLMRALSEAVLLPLYAAKPPGESAENFRNLWRARGLILTATLGATAVLAMIGEPLVRFLYDERYHSAGPLLVLIALAHVPIILSANYGATAVARGDSRRLAVIQWTSTAIRLPLLLWGASQWGVVGVAAAFGLSGVLFYPILALMVRRYGGWMWRQDLLFAALMIVAGGIAVWLNAPALSEVLATLQG